jgi:predicted phage terminase large subunit-like protein
MKELVKDDSVVVTRGHTMENVNNLTETFKRQVIDRHEGTRLGRQELAGEILEDIEGAMWQQGWIDDARVSAAPELARVVAAVDPAVTHGEDSDQTGIAVAGRGVAPCASCRAKGYASDWYVLHAQGYRLSPEGWARRAIALHQEYAGDRIIAERNNGGEMVEATLRHAGYSHTKTIVASRGKTVRAEPVAALYEQGRVHHVGVFAELEEQQTSFPVANELDDILDAVVYAITELEGGGWILE